MSGHAVLVVQNSQMHAQLIQTLASEGYCALCFHSVEEASAYLRDPACPASVAAFSLPMRRQSDFALVAELSKLRPRLQMLFASQERSSMLRALADANEALRFLGLPLNHSESIELLRQALRMSPQVPDPVSQHGFKDSSLYSEEFLRRVGMADVPVLLSGETGVGKEVLARRLCEYSARADKPFLKLNCAALPPELAESELFGSVKGAYTGSLADRQGRFETAQGGTILLDEIGDMDLRLQTKLLQVLQDGEIQPLGGNRSIRVNVRVMAATHRDLTRGIEMGTFREDLYYRLNVVKLIIPPLRERREEILPLADTLLLRHLALGVKAPVITEELRRFLIDYPWPGNVRELENVMRRFLVYQHPTMLMRELQEGLSGSEGDGGTEKVASLPQVRQPERNDAARSADRLDRLAEASRTAETELLLDALEANRWNRRQAAASLQIDYKAFLYKLQKYGIVESKTKRREVSA
jgi:DNA-binding NtrC family response regulator